MNCVPATPPSVRHNLERRSEAIVRERPRQGHTQEAHPEQTTLRELRVLYQPKVDGHGRPMVVGHARSQAQFVTLLARILDDEPNEVLGMLCLSTKHSVLAYHEISRGTLDGTRVSPRDVFKVALLANAAAIVLGHNHPSGDPTPSPSDIAMTRRLAHVGRLLGIDVLDHLIVTNGRYISLQEHCQPSTAARSSGEHFGNRDAEPHASVSTPATSREMSASDNARDTPPISTDEFLNFERMLDRLLSVPHSVVAERIGAHRERSANNPRRRGPKPKVRL
jgi:DNA repair protein RadC